MFGVLVGIACGDHAPVYAVKPSRFGIAWRLTSGILFCRGVYEEKSSP